MKFTIELFQKSLQIEISDAALQELERQTVSLTTDMELYFSCLIRKRVRFYHNANLEGAVPVTRNLWVRFLPVMTKSCNIDDLKDSKPDLTEFHLKHPEKFVPHWLTIDLKKDQFVGKFGYIDL